MKAISPFKPMPVWRSSPFIRLLIPFITGIAFQYYVGPGFKTAAICFCCFFSVQLVAGLLPLRVKYTINAIRGIAVFLSLLFAGIMAMQLHDQRNHENWFGHIYHDSDRLVIRVDEPLLAKEHSYKTTATVRALIHEGRQFAVDGKLLLYFAKDSLAGPPRCGDLLIIDKPLQPIRNSGNPGAFDYKRYCAFQQIFHTAFLKAGDFVTLEKKEPAWFSNWIYRLRKQIVDKIHSSISGNDEQAIAEALLIGYKEDLDKDLVQAYSNTGVVHIIAISGLHLGLIYLMLVWVFARIPFVKRAALLRMVLILTFLWLFSLLTGASASVLRSAVMFTFIVIGENLGKKASIYNSLAVSAFILLCYDPYLLWDVGFQLSYLAVIGIVVLQRPIYTAVYLENKWLDKVWKLAAVSLAAQVFTFPICLYYFHQFPNLFLLTNLVAVPLSSFILFAEIILLAFSWVPLLGTALAKLCNWSIWLMNKFILLVNEIPFAVWDGIRATPFSTFVLYAFVIILSRAVLNKSKLLLKASCCLVLCFLVVVAYNDWQIAVQKKIIIYNVPRHRAIDIAEGSSYYFIGDSALNADGALRNFHLKPGRIQLGLSNKAGQNPALYSGNGFMQCWDKRIILLDKNFHPGLPPAKIDVDMIVISGNPNIRFAELAASFNCGQYVFDASNSLWKIAKWKKDCEALHLRCYSIPEQGAFISER